MDVKQTTYSKKSKARSPINLNITFPFCLREKEKNILRDARERGVRGQKVPSRYIFGTEEGNCICWRRLVTHRERQCTSVCFYSECEGAIVSAVIDFI